MSILTLDIGGTKINVCRVTRNFQLKFLKRYSTQVSSVGSMRFFDEVKRILHEHLEKRDTHIGVSYNCISKDGVIFRSSVLGVENKKIPFEKIISKEFGRPCVLENDVKCTALAEYHFGAKKGSPSLTIVNIGTGLGIAHMENGKLFQGFMHAAGEVSPLFERKISGKGIAAMYLELTGKKKSAEEIAKSFREDKDAKKTFEEFSQRFATLLQSITLFYNPEYIILSGSVAKSSHLFLDKAFEFYKTEFPFREVYFKNIFPSSISFAPCRGIAWLVKTR